MPRDVVIPFSGRRHILKPIIPIAVLNGDIPIRYETLVDSGADFCIFDADIAEALEIDVMKGEKLEFAGIEKSNKVAEAYLHKINIVVGGHNYETIVGFSYDIAQHGHGVLGQEGFFNFFKVTFDLVKEEIELRPR